MNRDVLRKNAKSPASPHESDLTKQFYKIQDVAEIIGVQPSTIRFWEKEFEEIKPVRSGGNVRYYTPDMIRQLRIIHYLLKVKGMRIEAAKEQLHANKNNISRRLDVIEGLQLIKGDLQKLLLAMDKRR